MTIKIEFWALKMEHFLDESAQKGRFVFIALLIRSS
jgi:hypothetical protein